MKQNLKGGVSLLLAVLLLACGLTGCGGEEAPLTTFLPYAELDVADESVPTGTVCENARWQLLWDASTKRVSFADKATGALWGQVPAEAAEPARDESGRVKKNHPQMESALYVVYQDPNSFDDVTAYSYTGAVQSGEVYTERIENGLRVTYDFYDLEIAVPVDFTIADGSFSVSVDPTKIFEGEICKAHSVALAPFLCGLKNDAENSWLFLPDGSGAVVRPLSSGGVGVVDKQDVFGREFAYQSFSRLPETAQVYLPVFGAKKGNNALFAVLSSGAESASLNWTVGSDNIGYSTIYPQFTIRGFRYIRRPENFVTTTTLGAFKIFGEGIVTKPVSVTYFSLSGENADLDGMADCYRDYLTQTGGLKAAAQDEGVAAFKYVGALMQPAFFAGIPTKKLFPLTTTAQAETMTNELADAIGADISVTLAGFGKSGVDPGQVAGGFTVAGKLGGAKGMRKLSAALAAKNIPSYLDFDLLSFTKRGAGFSKRSAATYPDGQVVKYTTFDDIGGGTNDDRIFVLSRAGISRAAARVAKRAASLDLFGVSYASLSQFLSSDYTVQSSYVGGGMSEDVAACFDVARTAGYGTLASAPNVYAALSADRLADVPLYSSNFVMTSYDVPFYALVFKGYRPMSAVSLNLCADRQDALLRCVEAGVAPGYTLYYQTDPSLASSDHSFLYGGHYAGNRDEIIADVEGLADFLRSVAGVAVSDYTRLGDTASRTTYENGVWAIVNFGDAPLETEFGAVPAKSYLTGRAQN